MAFLLAGGDVLIAVFNRGYVFHQLAEIDFGFLRGLLFGLRFGGAAGGGLRLGLFVQGFELVLVVHGGAFGVG